MPARSCSSCCRCGSSVGSSPTSGSAACSAPGRADVSSVLVALRRLATDRAPAIGLGLLVLVTAFLVGVAPRLMDRVSDDALHGVVAEAPALGRNVALLEETGYQFTPGNPLAAVEAE